MLPWSDVNVFKERGVTVLLWRLDETLKSSALPLALVGNLESEIQLDAGSMVVAKQLQCGGSCFVEQAPGRSASNRCATCLMS